MDPKALEQIFATQGHYLTDEQLEEFIAHCRAERARIAAAEAAGKPIRKAKEPASTDAPLNLSDLLGGL